MKNMILQNCAWENTHTHTDTHMYVYIYIYIYTFWAFSKGEERQSGWGLCVNRGEKIKKFKKNDISMK